MRRLPVLFLFLALITAAVAAADVLVTKGGERIETRGPWKVKGRTVVFTSKGGTLSSLRSDEIDLEASEQATAEANRPEPAVPPEPPKLKARIPQAQSTGEVVMTITNRDVGTAGGGTSTARNALGFDLSGLDEKNRKLALDELFTMGKSILKLHQQHDLHDPEGVRRAVGAFDGMARQLRAKAKRTREGHRRVLEQMADGMEDLAEMARTSPDSVVALFLDLPPREELDEAMDAIDMPEARAVFEEHVENSGG